MPRTASSNGRTIHRYRAEASRVIPGRWCVYDYQIGGIARREDGQLAYFTNRADARQWAGRNNRRQTKGCKTMNKQVTEPCDHCGMRPASRVFHGGKAQRYFHCPACDKKEQTHWCCSKCGRLYADLDQAVMHDTCGAVMYAPTGLEKVSDEPVIEHLHVGPSSDISHAHAGGRHSHFHGNRSRQRTVQYPSIEQLQTWTSDGGCETTDGCWTEPDGECEHGKKSWMLVMGLI